jgi:hypothetical protein
MSFSLLLTGCISGVDLQKEPSPDSGASDTTDSGDSGPDTSQVDTGATDSADSGVEETGTADTGPADSSSSEDDSGGGDTATTDSGDTGSVSGCLNGVDDDGDGWTDAADPDCASGTGEVNTTSGGGCNDGIDNDADGAVDAYDPDCTSAYASEAAGTVEMACDDGVDEDADGTTDCDDTDCAADPACAIVSIGCALADGVWQFSMTYEIDTCSLTPEMFAEVTCSGDGIFALSADLGGWRAVLDCVTGDASFDCAGSDAFGLTWTMTGEADTPGGGAASGEISATTSMCESVGDFTGTLAP